MSQLEERRRLDKCDSSRFHLHTCRVDVWIRVSHREPLSSQCKETVACVTWFIWLSPDSYLGCFPSQKESWELHSPVRWVTVVSILKRCSKLLQKATWKMGAFWWWLTVRTVLSGKTQVRVLPLKVFVQELSCSNLQTKFCSTGLVQEKWTKSLDQRAKRK